MHYADYHVHTSYSGDSSASLDEMVQQAISLGLNEIALTDHMEFDYPSVSYGTDAIENPDDYFKALTAVKAEYANQITVRLGIEMGLQPHIEKEILNFLKGQPLDFVIGSVHVVDHSDLYEGNYFIGKTKRQAYERYFDYMLEVVNQYDVYEVIGHLDYIRRYGSYADNTLKYSDYAEKIDALLRALIEKGKGIEVNTSGFRYQLNTTHPCPDIIKRYKALGGEIITLGSDAHKPDDIAGNFKEAVSFLKSAGFSAYTVFENKKPKMIDLK